MKRVMVFGTFDILHPGHIYFLRQARKYGDFLIVSLARDPIVKKIKGRKPLHSEKDRADMLKSLKLVNKVVLGSKKDYIGHIVKEKPDVIVLGYDQRAFTEGLKGKLAERGLRVKIVRIRAYESRLYKSRKFLKN
ncbi:MAG: FAD synthase [Candidatus Doudnabacteria bacterium]|nr:FAD synthase [Candidatus Doudnabacteria bacterium]